MAQELKIDTVPIRKHVHVEVKVETVRSASRRASQTIEDVTNKISREAGAEADKATADE
jgi:hypothetical protein